MEPVTKMEYNDVNMIQSMIGTNIITTSAI
jgi:hypothetical protein